MQELHEVANKRLYTMCHVVLRKDGVFFRLTNETHAKAKQLGHGVRFASQLQWQPPL